MIKWMNEWLTTPQDENEMSECVSKVCLWQASQEKRGILKIQSSENAMNMAVQNIIIIGK